MFKQMALKMKNIWLKNPNFHAVFGMSAAFIFTLPTLGLISGLITSSLVGYIISLRVKSGRSIEIINDLLMDISRGKSQSSFSDFRQLRLQRTVHLLAMVQKKMDECETKKIKAECMSVRVREEADRIYASKTQFIGEISNTLRRQVNAILEPLRTLDKLPMSAQEDELVKDALVDLYKLKDLNRDLLDFSCVEFGEIELSLSQSGVRNIIENELDRIAKKAGVEGIQFEVHYSGNAWNSIVDTDITRVRQVIQNGLENAIKHTSEGSITVRCHAYTLSGSECLLSVDIDDTGEGMSDDVLEEVTEILDSADSDEIYTDLGIGLALSARIAAALGGRLSIRSYEGKGTTLTFSLPLSVSGEGRVLIEREQSTIAKSVLLLDQEHTQLITNLVGLKSINIEHYSESGEAYDAFIKNDYDLIMVDLKESSNIAFINMIRSSINGEAVRIIGCVPEVSNQTDNLLVKLDLEDVIKKPTRGKDLYNCIHNNFVVRSSVAEALEKIAEFS